MGGRVFINPETDENPVSRIPTCEVEELMLEVQKVFRGCATEMKPATQPDLFDKEDHGDLDFVVWGPNVKERIREMAEKHGIETKNNGPMEHIMFPYKGKYHQIDFIVTSNKEDFDRYYFFYSNPVVFNAVVGHFARSIGYKFSTDGLLLHVTDRRKQNYYFHMTNDLKKMLQLLDLKNPEECDIYSSPEAFADWIMSSSRFDSQKFRDRHNKQSHRDSRKDGFCSEVYEILNNSQVVSDVENSYVNFSDPDFSLDERMAFETSILGQEAMDEVLAFCEEKSQIKEQVITGKRLIEMGYSPGPVIGKIIREVSELYDLDSNKEEVEAYVEKTYYK